MNHSSGAVNYGKEQVYFSVLYSARKTLGIEVHPDGNVLVKAPVGTEPEEIHQKVFKHVRWILRQQQYFRQFDPRTPGRQFVGGETHLYLGRQYRLKIINGSQDSVKLIRGYFRVELKSPPCSDRIKYLLDRWYAEKAANKFKENFDRCWPYFEKFNQMKPRLHIRCMRKRWGSLSKNGLLTLNTDLIRAPVACIEYVITHELCHIQFHNHSSDFYRLLEKVMPDWEKRKHRLELALV
ncbi:MAG: M48 family metallopeptidase [Deltaproteobacteria bacterium]|nr:M48 family metallopeptidase [Deltaproteobacteria bacterium]